MTERTVTAFIGAILLGLLTGCTSMPVSDLYPPSPQSSDNVTIFFVAYESHTGIIVNREHVGSRLPVLRDDFEDWRYLEFGWGDLGWYNSEEHTFGMGFTALFVPTESGLWVWSAPTEPDKFFAPEYIAELTLSRQGFYNMLEFINDSFALDQELKRQKLREGTFKKGAFKIYRAKGAYHAFHNCNHWTAEALEKAGFSVGSFERYSGDSFLQTVKSRQNKLFPPH